MKIANNVARYCLIVGISLGLSILFQIYWLGMDGPHMREGGSAFRLSMKVIALSFIYAGLHRSFSVGVFAYNIALKVPLLFYFATVLLVIPYIYNNAYNQAMNLAFFIPFLFVDFTGTRGVETYRFIIKVIVCVVAVHVFIDFAIKAAGLQMVNILLGGMGNANTFGLFLITSAMAFRFIYFRENISRLFLLLVMSTGSLACFVIAFLLFLHSFFVKLKLKMLPGFLISLASIALLLFSLRDRIFQDGGPVWHTFMKLLGLINYVLNGQSAGTASVSIREEYTNHGLLLLSENPLAVIFGHPDFLPFYSGDGLYIALLVTVGLPVTFLFVLCNVIAVYRGLREGQPLSKFSAYIILTFLVLFASNRILDYWPAGLIYMLTFSYLVRKRDIGLSSG